MITTSLQIYRTFEISQILELKINIVSAFTENVEIFLFTLQYV